LLCAAPLRRPVWSLVPGALKGSVFLLSLVLTASMMPVEKLPASSWQTAFELGFLSAVFDNIPLTALALKQGGYDWGMLAYAVGFGGSMIWFGSSAGVALSNSFPEARSVGAWLRHGWHVAVAYVLGFFVLLAVVGWQPGTTREASVPTPPRNHASISTCLSAAATLDPACRRNAFGTSAAVVLVASESLRVRAVCRRSGADLSIQKKRRRFSWQRPDVPSNLPAPHRARGAVF
ncbi:MAG: hypothetical protein ACREVF_08995, partial [Burkholderiales bacterium]